jgi:hypothetical protein
VRRENFENATGYGWAARWNIKDDATAGFGLQPAAGLSEN